MAKTSLEFCFVLFFVFLRTYSHVGGQNEQRLVDSTALASSPLSLIRIKRLQQGMQSIRRQHRQNGGISRSEIETKGLQRSPRIPSVSSTPLQARQRTLGPGSDDGGHNTAQAERTRPVAPLEMTVPTESSESQQMRVKPPPCKRLFRPLFLSTHTFCPG